MPDNTDHVKRPYINGTPVRPRDSQRSLADEEGVSVEQKMAGSVLDLKKIYPFLFAALYVIPRIESKEIGSIAVSLDKLYYNSEFILETPRSALTFYIIHGLYHILMRHHIRGEGKDPLDWNKACDLYINKCIERTLGVRPGEGIAAVPGENVYVEMPETELFDNEIDVEKDTPELIYARIHQDEEQEEQQSSDESGGQGESGETGEGEEQGQESDSGEGTGGSGEQENEDSGDDESDSMTDESEETTPDENEPQESDEEDQDQNNGDAGNDSTSDQDQGSEDDGSSDEEPEDSDVSPEDYSESDQSTESEQYTPDMIDDSDSKKDSATSKAQKFSRMLSKIDTINKQMATGNYGRGTAYDPVADAQIHEDAERINWRVLLQNRLISMVTDEKSLSHPDRRFVHTGLYLEGPVTEENRLSGIKICIDTSASMSDSDIATALFQIQNLLKQYKLEADLVFWDEEIESITPFNNVREFKIAKSEAKGRGGTNPECIFREFMQTNKKGHMAPNPRLVLIFTDGFFERPDKKYKRAFDSSTIWILCSEESEKLEDFNPGFGKRIEMKFN